MASNASIPPPTFNITPSTLADNVEQLLLKVQRAVNALVDTVAPGHATFDNAVRPLAHIDNEFKAEVQYMALFQSVAPSPALRKASSDAMNVIEKTYLALFQDARLFALVDAVCRKDNQAGLDGESRRLLVRFHRMFVDNGLELTGARRDRFNWIANRLIELRVAFMENLGGDPGSVWKSHRELDGLAESKLSRLDKGLSGTRRIHLKRPDINAVLTQCSVAKTRKEVFLRSQSIYPSNVGLFQEAVALRDEAARLLGFSSFASQKLRHQIAQSPRAVNELLDDLKAKLQPLARREIQCLQKLSEQDTPLHLWDFDYYHHRMLQEEYNVDHELISEYFPADVTIRRMLDVFEKLLGLSIVELDGKEDDQVWHPDVKVFAVWDTQNPSFLGYLYTDIYPRPGKYNHAANFNIYPGYLKDDGQRASVATALVCNVSQSSTELPALLQHREVITIFHELGHAMHDLLGKTQYALFHGHRTVRDFVEAPSQLLEFWCWVPECLQKLSCHYSYLSPEYREGRSYLNGANSGKQPPKEIPEALVKALVAAKQVNQGTLTLRQVAFSRFDMQIHDPVSHEAVETLSIGEVYNSLLQGMTLLDGPEGRSDWGNGHVTTSHYMWGQEANYYSYLYTRIFAADMWFSNFREDPMSEEAGLRYRRMILEKGGSQDELKVLADFLGRPPKPDAYLQDLGVNDL